MTVVSPQRLRNDFVALTHRGLDVKEYTRSVARLLAPQVPFRGICLLTLDPATLLPTGEVVENGLPHWAMPRMAEIELAEEDFNKFTDLARARQPASTLSEATGGDLDRSLRHRELKRPLGFGDELRAALVADSGTWGGLTLLRKVGDPPFTSTDASLLASLTSLLTEGLRRAILVPRPPVAEDGEVDTNDDPPGVLVLAGDGSIELADAPGRRWLSELTAGRGPDGPPLSVLVAVARRAREAVAGHSRGPIAAARVRTPSGRWLFVRGSLLGDGSDGRAAVIIERAHADQMAPLVAEAYGLNERERAVTQLVARGLSTGQIASRLYLSPYTVQDHLKSIFDKVAVRTRGELVARVFFDHDAPRLTSWDSAEPVRVDTDESARPRR